MVSVSDRIQKTPASPMRKLVPFANVAKKTGVHVYHLNIGDPDIKTPSVMLHALKSWDINPIGYSQSHGQPEFLESLKWYYHKIGHKFVDITDIQVTSGGSEGISMALFATCQPGDEVIVFEPFYANYNTYAVVNDVRLIPIRTLIENGFHLPSEKDITKHITKKTKAILVCSPNNPTGTVFSRSEMDMIIGIAKKHNLFVLSDEVYREFAYDGRKQVSLLSYMEEIPNQAVMIDSMSKRYSLCGVRLGAIVSLNKDIMAGVLRLGQGRLSSGLVDQMITSRLTKVPPSYFTSVRKEYTKRRDVLYEGLKAIPGVVIPKPEGAFYTIVGLPIADSEHFCHWLLTEFRDKNETVMVAPASGFYATANAGKNEIRIAYVLNVKALKRSIELLTNALIQYKKLHS